MATLIIYTENAIHSRSLSNSATWRDILAEIRSTGAHREKHYSVELNGRDYAVTERGLKEVAGIDL